MNIEEAVGRSRVVNAAQSYVGTPYHHYGKVKGVGVDCLTLIVAVYEEAKLTGLIHVPEYSHQWHLNHGAELYLQGLLKYTEQVDHPQFGDIAVWQFGRCFSHGAIVTGWPRIVHAYMGRGCVTEDVDSADWLKYSGEKLRPVKFFSFWGK